MKKKKKKFYMNISIKEIHELSKKNISFFLKITSLAAT